MQLSQKAIKDLRTALNKSYGDDFDSKLNDEQVNKLGNLFLTVMAESLKLEIANPELFTNKS